MAESRTLKIKTTGMHCQSCSMLIQMNLEDLEGVQSAHADVASGMTEVTYDPDAVAVDDLVGAVVAAGYGAEPEE
jgi:copper chaperone CopZ